MRYPLILLSLIICVQAAWAAVDVNKYFERPGEFTAQDGPSLYEQNCRGCHMPEGRGAHEGVGMYPKLAQDPAVQSADYVATVVMNGLRGMPSFSMYLNDEQIAAVANYVSTSFGNKGDGSLKAEAVKAMRPAVEVEYLDW